ESLTGCVREIGCDDDAAIRRTRLVGDYQQRQLRGAQQSIDRFPQCKTPERLVARHSRHDEIATFRFCELQDGLRRVAVHDPERDLVAHVSKIVAQLPTHAFEKLRVRLKGLRKALAPDGMELGALLQYVNGYQVGGKLPHEDARAVRGPIASGAQVR